MSGKGLSRRLAEMERRVECTRSVDSLHLLPEDRAARLCSIFAACCRRASNTELSDKLERIRVELEADRQAALRFLQKLFPNTEVIRRWQEKIDQVRLNGVSAARQSQSTA